MRRREFIAAVSSAAAAWPLVARAQQAGRLPTIGFLRANTATSERAATDVFVQRATRTRLDRESNRAIEYRWAQGRDERFAEIATKFARLKVDVIHHLWNF
jgi:putative ABC transport system substrate-binding protein